MTLKDLLNRMEDTERIIVEVDGKVLEACKIWEFFEKYYLQIHYLYSRQVIRINYSDFNNAIWIELG